MEMSRRSLKTPESTFTPDEIPVEPTFAKCVLYIATSYQTTDSLTDAVPAEEMVIMAIGSKEEFGDGICGWRRVLGKFRNFHL